jgi:hypothetical protein
VVATLALGTRAEALIKCPQADGSVITVPDSMGCATRPQLERERADQAANARRRQAERGAEARQEQSADFVRASQVCTQQQNRAKFREPEFKAIAKPDGSVRMLGTAQERFDYQTCMDQQGHPLTTK